MGPLKNNRQPGPFDYLLILLIFVLTVIVCFAAFISPMSHMTYMMGPYSYAHIIPWLLFGIGLITVIVSAIALKNVILAPNAKPNKPIDQAPKTPILLEKGSTTYFRTKGDPLRQPHIILTQADRGLYISIDPHLSGDKHYFSLDDLSVMLSKENPLRFKKFVCNLQVVIFWIVKIDQSAQSIEVVLADNIEI